MEQTGALPCKAVGRDRAETVGRRREIQGNDENKETKGRRRSLKKSFWLKMELKEIRLQLHWL